MYIALRHCDNMGVTIGVRSPEDAGELVQRAQVGDTFHKIELATCADEVMEQVDAQLATRQYRKVS